MDKKFKKLKDLDVKKVDSNMLETVKDGILAKFPALGVTMHDLKYEETESLSTAATDGEKVFYNPNFIKSLNYKEKLFSFTHEIMHIAFDHVERSANKDLVVWNIATDAVINQMLKKAGLPLPKGVVDIKEAYGKSADEMYEKLISQKQDLAEKFNQGQSGNGGRHDIWQEAAKRMGQNQTGQSQQQNNMQNGNQQQQNNMPQNVNQQQNGMNQQQNGMQQNSNQQQGMQQNGTQQQGTQQNSNQQQQGAQPNGNQQGMQQNGNQQQNNMQQNGSQQQNANQQQQQHGIQNGNSQNSNQQRKRDEMQHANQQRKQDEMQHANLQNNEQQENAQQEQQQEQQGQQHQQGNEQQGQQEQQGQSDDQQNQQQEQQGQQHQQGNEQQGQQEQQGQSDDQQNQQQQQQGQQNKQGNEQQGQQQEQQGNEQQGQQQNQQNNGQQGKQGDEQQQGGQKGNEQQGQPDEQSGNVGNQNENNPHDGNYNDIEAAFVKNNEALKKAMGESIRDEIKTLAAGVGNGQNSTTQYGAVGDAKEVISWKKILKREIEKEEDRWSYRRASEDNYYSARIESLEAYERAETEVMLDVSGSIEDDFLKAFLRQLKPLLKESKIKVGFFADRATDKFQEIKKASDIDNLRIIRPGCGTNMDAAARAFSESKRVNKIVFTDGEAWGSDMPQNDLKDRKILWIVYSNKDFNPCCGKVIFVSESDLKNIKSKKNEYYM